MRFVDVARLTVSLLVASWLTVPVAVGAGPAAAGQVEQVTLTSDEHGPVVLIRTSRPLRYRSQLLASPPRLVVDFEDARFAWRGGPLQPGSGPIVAVRGSQFRSGVARVVIAMGRAVPHRFAGTPDGLRIAFPLTPSAPSAAPRASIEPSPAAPGPGLDPAARPILYGIVLRGEDSVAYLEDPRTRRVTGFKRGDALGDGVLETIEERHVTVRMPSGPIRIRVDDPKPGQAAPARRIQIGPGATRP